MPGSWSFPRSFPSGNTFGSAGSKFCDGALTLLGRGAVWMGSIPTPPPPLKQIERNEMHGIIQFFAYAHLPAHLQEISKPFGELAELIVNTLPLNPERTAALRKLLEAKDCAVRAKLYVEPTI